MGHIRLLTPLLSMLLLAGLGSILTRAPSYALRGDAGRPAASQTQQQTAPPKMKRLPPSALRELPRGIVKKLEARGCTIPQVSVEGIGSDRNVVRGQFARRGQTDWAVLCSRKGVSAIHIFWGKPTRCPGIIAAAPDDTERFIGSADAGFILGHYENYGGLKPPPLRHEGINDGFAESASRVWYCYRGKWLRLTGAD